MQLTFTREVARSITQDEELMHKIADAIDAAFHECCPRPVAALGTTQLFLWRSVWDARIPSFHHDFTGFSSEIFPKS